MNVEIFDPLLPCLRDKLVPFSASLHGKNWQDVYETVAFLNLHYPESRFKSEPHYYLDLKQKKFGLLFEEQDSERLYFVYE